LQVIIFQEQKFDRLSLGEKEKGLGADSGLRYEKLGQKYVTPKSGTWHARATSSTVVPAFKMLFCCFCFIDKLPISLLLT